MNEDLKRLLATLKMNSNLRMRLNKIFDELSPVTSIDLRGYEHGQKLEVCKKDLLILLQICKAIPTLRSLTILGHELDDTSALILAEAAADMGKLEALNIDSSNIGDKGATKIANAVSRHGSIKYVCLHGENMGNLATDAIAMTVTNNPNITRLSIQGTHIDDEGIMSLLNLSLLNRLEQIVIIGGSANSSVCIEIGKKLAKDNKLRSFVLEVDDFENLAAVLDGVRINSFLTDITLIARNFTPSQNDAIAEVLRPIKQRNEYAQGLYQRKIDDVLAYAHECFGLQTHTLDDALLEKLATMMLQGAPQVSFFKQGGAEGSKTITGQPLVENALSV